MKLRRFQASDADQIAQLFHDTIRTVNLGDYSEEQVKAWAPDDIYFRDWVAKCTTKHTLVAEYDGGVITGFAELDDDGHIDCFYCHKDYQGQGIGQILCNGIEKEAQNRGFARLFVEASITAKPFFQKMGFSIIEEQSVKNRGEQLTNFRMEKILSP